MYSLVPKGVPPNRNSGQHNRGIRLRPAKPNNHLGNSDILWSIFFGLPRKVNANRIIIPNFAL